MDSDGVFNRAGEPRLGEGIGGERIVNDIIWRLATEFVAIIRKSVEARAADDRADAAIVLLEEAVGGDLFAVGLEHGVLP